MANWTIAGFMKAFRGGLVPKWVDDSYQVSLASGPRP